MGQERWLNRTRTLTALAGDSSSLPNIHVVTQQGPKRQFKEGTVHTQCTYTHAGTTLTQK